MNKLPWTGIHPRIVGPGPGDSECFLFVTISHPGDVNDGRHIRVRLTPETIDRLDHQLRDCIFPTVARAAGRRRKGTEPRSRANRKTRTVHRKRK